MRSRSYLGTGPTRTVTSGRRDVRGLADPGKVEVPGTGVQTLGSSAWWGAKQELLSHTDRVRLS